MPGGAKSVVNHIAPSGPNAICRIWGEFEGTLYHLVLPDLVIRPMPPTGHAAARARARSRSQAERPLGIVVIGGLSSSLILTLVLIPIMYLRFAPQRFRPSSANGQTDADQIELPLQLASGSTGQKVKALPISFSCKR